MNEEWKRHEWEEHGVRCVMLIHVPTGIKFVMLSTDETIAAEARAALDRLLVATSQK